MLTNIIMIGIVLFLAGVLGFRDKKGKTAEFFDQDTSLAMRGFWCLIVVLVHIPYEPVNYTNTIQDLIGSFAYIGVTFFFMTSGFGLTLAAIKRPDPFIKGFWSKRLIKLLIPMAIVNTLVILAKFIAERSFDPWDIVHINGWVRILLIFYFIVWAVHRFAPSKWAVQTKSFIVIGVVIILSLTIYFFNGLYLFGWPTELYGCIYGILMALLKDKFKEFALKFWWLKAICCLLLSGILGIAYIHLKWISFFGEYLLKILLSSAILSFVFILNAKISIGNPVSRFLGSISYEVYLSHSVAFILLETLPLRLSSGLFILCALGITVLLSFGIKILASLLPTNKRIRR